MIDIISLFLHLDKALAGAVADYGLWIYAVLFIIIFLETGLVVAPFLPGDSLLFVAGALAALRSLDVLVILATLMIAAVLGDTVNYWIGHSIGKRLVRKKMLNKDHLKQAEDFYERHGGKTIIIARFLPFIRTFAPFVAGLGKMKYGRFLSYNIIGGVVWVTSFTLAGYWFGNIPLIKENLSLFIIAIIVITITAALIGLLREKKRR